MDFTAEKKESENNNNYSDNTQKTVDSFAHDANNNTNKEVEERQARDLKAGLHPLKVCVSHFHVLSLLPILRNQIPFFNFYIHSIFSGFLFNFKHFFFFWSLGVIHIFERINELNEMDL